MIQSLFSAANGMITLQTNIDTIANNVANVNTNGYKKVRMDFKDCIYERIQNPVDNGPQMNLQRGAGAIMYQTLRVFEQGVLKSTENPFDLALEGPGFFKMLAPDGTFLYSRNGQLNLSVEQDGSYLVDDNGNYILDANDDRIMVLGEPKEFVVAGDGSIEFRDAEGNAIAGPALNIVNFDNPAGLQSVGAYYYVPTENSGDPVAASADTAVKQRVLESSNVDYAEEMTRLIRSQRAYQLMARAIATADQMAQTANTIRG